MKRNLLEALVAGAFLHGCAYGSIDSVNEVVNNQNCLPPAITKCGSRAQANTVHDLEVSRFEIDSFKAEFTAFNFSPETKTFMLSYGTTKKENKYGMVEASAGDVVTLPDGSTVYVGKIDFKTKWAFLYYASKEVPTREINLLASGDHKTTSEEFVFTSNCITRNYEVEVFQAGELMSEEYVGPGAVISWGKEKAVLHDQYEYANGFWSWSYGYGIDAFLSHRFNAGEGFTHSIVYFFEDAYKCK